MTTRDGDIVMAGLLLGALFFFALVASRCTHFPRGPTSCCAVGAAP